MIIFKILLVILVALPVIIIASALFLQIAGYVNSLNRRDRKRDEQSNAGSGRRSR